MPEKMQYKLRDMMKNTGVMVSVGLNRNTPVHSHDCIQICYVYNGHAEQLLGDKIVKLTKGDYYIVDTDEEHWYTDVSENFPQICIRFLPSLMWQGFSDDWHADELIAALCGGNTHNLNIESVKGKIYHDKNANILRRCRSIRKEWEKRLPGWRQVAAGELAAILLTMARTVEEFPAHKSNTSFVNSIIKYVEAHYAEPIQLDRLCRMCNYTMSYVSRVFRESTGKPFSEYLLEYRVNKACSLLEETNMTIAKIGNAVGYSNTSFFYRTFKSYTGFTPKDWRLQHKVNKESTDTQ